jgi:hypothetical protein
MIEAKLENGRFVKVAASSKKGVAQITIENHDPAHVGITKAVLTVNSGSEIAAADLLSYLSRDLGFTLILKQTFGE